jgi:hypothetical protein
VQFRSFGNLAANPVKPAPVSHDSHRYLKKACAKQMSYVKSAFRTAWIKGFRRTRPAQGTVDPQLPQTEKEDIGRWERV